MKSILIAAALLLCCNSADAQSPAPVPAINGPTTARTGDLILLDASGSTATHFDWLVDTSGVQVPSNGADFAKSAAAKLRGLGWEVKPPKKAEGGHYLILDGGKRLLLASYPGTWRVSLAVGNANGVKQLPWTLVVQGHGPQPPPEPEPKPPGPDVPLPTSKVGRGIYDAGMASKSPTRVADAKLMIAALEKFRPSVAATQMDAKSIVAGALTAMLTSLSDAAKKEWQLPMVTHLAVPLSQAVTDKATGLQAIDDMLAGLKAVTK